MNGSKKFPDMDGMSFEDIRKTISEFVSEAVNSAVDGIVDAVVDEIMQFAPSDVRKNVKKRVREARAQETRTRAKEGGYSSEKIPRTFPEPSPEPSEEIFPPVPLPEAYPPDHPPQNDPNLIYQRYAPATSQIYYPPERLSENMTPHDEEIVMKIRQMRELQVCIRGQGIVKRAVELTMIEQGEFMKDVEDDFTHETFCALPQPIYAAMSISQLRWFFSWRTEARHGRYHKTDKPYVLLLCYELLNKIGADSSVDAFGKLLELWENCRPFASSYLDSSMPRWLKDFYVFNDVTAVYPDINAVMKKYDVEYEYDSYGGEIEQFLDIEERRFSGKLDYLMGRSSYNMKKSVFLSDETKPLIEGALTEALAALDEYFRRRGIELSELICGKLRKVYAWTPFKDAIVNLDTADGFRPLKISAAERYCVKRGEPALEQFIFEPSKEFIGYILKSAEAELRVKTGFNRRITAKLDAVIECVDNRAKLTQAITDPEFAKVIPRAVDEYCRKNGIRSPEKAMKSSEGEERVYYTSQKVEIDVSKLDEIRRQSDEITRKLIVDIEPDEPAEAVSEEEFSEAMEECKEELSPREEEAFALADGDPIFNELDADWQSFARDLIPSHIRVLKALLGGNARAFCRENGMLPETVFEEINTSSLSAFGDVVIECGELVADYVEDVRKIVSAANI